MGFLNGRVTAQRFRVDGPPPRLFTDEHLERLDHFRAGRDRIASIDGIECGWTAGGHILDTAFEPEKNIVNDALLFELRIDTDKLPSDLLKAYIEVELKAIVADVFAVVFGPLHRSLLDFQAFHDFGEELFVGVDPGKCFRRFVSRILARVMVPESGEERVFWRGWLSLPLRFQPLATPLGG